MEGGTTRQGSTRERKRAKYLRGTLIKAFTLRHSDFSSAFAVLDVLEEAHRETSLDEGIWGDGLCLAEPRKVCRSAEDMGEDGKSKTDEMMLGCLSLACSETSNAQKAQGLVSLVRQHRLPLTPEWCSAGEGVVQPRVSDAE